MNVLQKYTRKTLLLNRTRTIVTIVGIVLSVAMLTAVTTLISSVQQYMIDNIEASSGGWYGEAFAADTASLQTALADERVEKAAVLDMVGYAAIGEADNDYKPYLYVGGMEDGFADLIPVDLVTGRLPENTSEILIPEHLLQQTGLNYALGDSLTLTLGDRVTEDGWTLDQSYSMQLAEDDVSPEHLTERENRTYTVVGIYQRPSFEDYAAPGYTLLTVSDGTARTADVWVRTVSPTEINAYMQAYFNACGMTFNTDLLRMTASSGEDTYNRVLYSFGGILIVIIVFASVALIYNAFSISVSERTRQFGLLSSVGATRRQLTHCVLYEALVLSGVGIPLGVFAGMAGIGITLACTSGLFNNLFVQGTQDLQLRLSVSWQAVVIATALGLLTVLFSAWLPARRSTRLSPIEAIRQSEDVKIKAKGVRTGKLTAKLFGFEGTLASKNFKRARKKYRATVFSLSVSVLLFISASSFCTYLSNSAEMVVSDFQFDLYYSPDGEDAEAVHRILSGVDGVERSAMIYTENEQLVFQTDALRSGYVRDMGDPSSDTQSVQTMLCFVEDAAYDDWAAEQGLGEEYTSGQSAVALNFVKSYNLEENRYYTYEPLLGPTSAMLGDQSVTVGCLADQGPLGTEIVQGVLTLVFPERAINAVLGEDASPAPFGVYVAPDHTAVFDRMCTALQEAGYPSYMVSDYASGATATRSLLTILQVFSYGFITLISLISVANVFNTISTNVQLRRREFATLSSVGMTRRSFRRMMDYECLLYGLKGLAFGLPLSFLVTLAIYISISNGLVSGFYLPWTAVMIAVGSVFLVVFATMLYATRKLEGRNLVETMKSETL